ncbi:MAG: hypothetical protein QOD27_1603 [Microbacteriaceae bacterium]|jgi:hypothetical protein|nr:hypothetical protein [Microbacteriaceae bacterium]MDQ1554753.1 hypothetical protein [Microbacteriaceae bacterium]MDQ1578685.1 hypothetical protein [Microbacteriaceae bacterium]
MTSETATTGPTPAGRAAWPVWAIAILFAVLYSYALWVGIGNAVGVPQTSAAMFNLGISPIGWVVLILGIVVSPAFFVAALLLGRGRRLYVRALIYFTGLCAVSAVMSSLIVAPHFINILS